MLITEDSWQVHTLDPKTFAIPLPVLDGRSLACVNLQYEGKVLYQVGIGKIQHADDLELALKDIYQRLTTFGHTLSDPPEELAKYLIPGLGMRAKQRTRPSRFEREDII